jgi:hypothetical protein
VSEDEGFDFEFEQNAIRQDGIVNMIREENRNGNDVNAWSAKKWVITDFAHGEHFLGSRTRDVYVICDGWNATRGRAHDFSKLLGEFNQLHALCCFRLPDEPTSLHF